MGKARGSNKQPPLHAVKAANPTFFDERNVAAFKDEKYVISRYLLKIYGKQESLADRKLIDRITTYCIAPDTLELHAVFTDVDGQQFIFLNGPRNTVVKQWLNEDGTYDGKAVPAH